MLTRLEKTLYRLEAQHACLKWAFDEIASMTGVVFEMGLGHGRTFDHLRRHLPDREIYVFDRAMNAYPDCAPDDAYLILGEVEKTLPAAAERFRGQVVLAHSDIGSFDRDHNRRTAAMLSPLLAPALAPNAIVLSDLELELEGCSTLPLPPGAREDRYHIYRRHS